MNFQTIKTKYIPKEGLHEILPHNIKFMNRGKQCNQRFRNFLSWRASCTKIAHIALSRFKLIREIFNDKVFPF